MITQASVYENIVFDLLKIKNEISLNASFYSADEFYKITRLCEDIDATIQINLEALNYDVDR